MSKTNIQEVKGSFIESSSVIKKYKISPEDVETLIHDYQESVLNTLLSYGYVQVSDNLRLEVVKLKQRKHVLRGQAYDNWRKYKLKAKMNYTLHGRVAETFNELLEV